MFHLIQLQANKLLELLRQGALVLLKAKVQAYSDPVAARVAVREDCLDRAAAILQECLVLVALEALSALHRVKEDYLEPAVVAPAVHLVLPRAKEDSSDLAAQAAHLVPSKVKAACLAPAAALAALLVLHRAREALAPSAELPALALLVELQALVHLVELQALVLLVEQPVLELSEVASLDLLRARGGVFSVLEQLPLVVLVAALECSQAEACRAVRLAVVLLAVWVVALVATSSSEVVPLSM
jgi:hypothetical protein